MQTCTSQEQKLPGITLQLFTALVIKDSVVNITWVTDALKTAMLILPLKEVFNAIDFNMLEDVGGSNTTNTRHTYSLIDPHPFNGVSYYRLKQTNYNGSYNYSAMQSINIEVLDTTPVARYYIQL